MWLFLIILCITYLALTVLGTHLPIVPDLLVVMIIFAGPASLWRNIWYGCITGILLDLTTGLGLYHTAIYTLAGAIIGIMPSTILQTNTAASLVNTLLGTLTIHLGYALLTKIFTRQFLLMPWYMLLLQLVINCCFVWILLKFGEWNRGKQDEIR